MSFTFHPCEKDAHNPIELVGESRPLYFATTEAIPGTRLRAVRLCRTCGRAYDEKLQSGDKAE